MICRTGQICIVGPTVADNQLHFFTISNYNYPCPSGWRDRSDPDVAIKAYWRHLLYVHPFQTTFFYDLNGCNLSAIKRIGWLIRSLNIHLPILTVAPSSGLKKAVYANRQALISGPCEQHLSDLHQKPFGFTPKACFFGPGLVMFI